MLWWNRRTPQPKANPTQENLGWKWHLGRFFPQQIIFRALGLILYRKQGIQETQPNQTLCKKHAVVCVCVCSSHQSRSFFFLPFHIQHTPRACWFVMLERQNLVTKPREILHRNALNGVDNTMTTLLYWARQAQHTHVSCCRDQHLAEIVFLSRSVRTVFAENELGWVRFLVVRFLHKINPNLPKNICCGKKWPKMPLITYFFLGWVRLGLGSSSVS